MKLISMTDFVLEQSKKIMNCELTHLESHHKIVDYANFLKQPLKLEMFVPCDEDGNILEDVTGQGMIPYYVEKVHRFLTAKEKVLFEGFYVKNDDDGKLCLFHQDYEWDIATIEPNFVWGRTNEFTIEDIVNHNPKLSLFVLNENSIYRLLQACC